jgi:phosphatidylglycerol lysyltransferase
VAIAFVLGCTVWLMVLSFDQGQYRHQLWWQFSAEASASRSLRAAAGVLVTLAVVWGVQRRRARPSAAVMPTLADLQTTRQLVARSPHASAHLALLGDKRLLFSRDHTAMIMYGIHGRSWISMGDPVGPSTEARDLAWTFREMCEQRDQRPVFYQVREDRVNMYVEMGLTLIKLGEEARVFLPGFGQDSARDLVTRFQQRDRADCQFHLVQPPLDDPLMDQLRAVSDAWCAEHGGLEKRFSMGYFQEDYLRACPVALAQRQGKVIGFANLWLGADQHELSIDMLRFLPEAPRDILDFLFIHTMLWGREQGYQWFPMGMTPLAALNDRPVDPIWRKAASIAFRHDQNFSTPQRLRKFKERFDPVWASTYLAAPETFALPVIIADIAALVSGGADTSPR